MNKSPPQKTRAVFLAVLIVISVFTGSVAFAGSTSATAASLDLGSGDGTPHTVDLGATLEEVQVDDDDADNATIHVFIDENNNGQYDDGEAVATNMSAYNGTGTDSNIDIGPLKTDGIGAGTYTVYATENESLTPGDSTFDTNVELTIEEVPGAANLDLGNGDNNEHTVAPGTDLQNVQVDDDTAGSSAIYVFIDENDNGQYDDGEANATNTSTYSGNEDNIDIGALSTDSLGEDTYTVYATENEPLTPGDNDFETNTQLTIEEPSGASNLDLGSGKGNDHTIDRGTDLENVLLDDDTAGTSTLFVFVDENGNGEYDNGEPSATNESAYNPNQNDVAIGTLQTGELDADTYDVYAYENESLTPGDSEFDTSVRLMIQQIADSDDYDVDIFFNDYDALIDEQLLWGQEVAVAGFEPNSNVVLREWEGQDDGSRTAEQLTADDNGVTTFDSAQLENGDYYLDPPEEAGLDAPPTTFEILPQELDVTFNDDEVREQGTTTVEFDSNRGSYAVNVTADSLDAEELAMIFGDSEGQNGELEIETVDDSEDRITLATLNDGEYDIGFTGIDTGEYEFEFEVTDTSASDSATIEVTELDVDGEFSEGSYVYTAGDIAEMTIELEDTDDAFVQFGDEEAGFIDVLYIEDEDDDDEVTFQVNTRALGTNARYEEVYHSEDDIVESELHGGISSAARDPVFVDEDGDDLTASGASDGSFAAYLDELGLIDADDETPTNQLVRPLQPTDYDIAVGGDNTFIVNDDEESVLNDELDLTVLDLTRPNLGEIETFVAPADTADENDEIGELREALTAREEVAFDDRLIIRAEASGIYGHMVAIEETSGEDGFSALEEGFSAKTLHTLVDERDGEGVNLEVQADDAIGNQEPTSLNLGSDTVNEQDIFVLADNTEGVLYIVVDTSSSDAFNNDIDTETDFTVEFEYETDEDDSYEFESAKGPLGGAGGDPDSPAFPYFQPGESQSKSAAFTIAEREVLFANPNDEGIIEVAVGGITDTREGTIFGSTNVAPGSDASVRIRSDRGVSPSFAGTNDVMIDEEGEFEATFEFTDANLNNTAEVTFRVGGSTVGSNKMVIVEQLEPTPAETTTVETTTETTTRIPTVTRGTVETSPPTTTIGTPIPTPTTTPGFGVGTALVALVAAALLVVRREI